MTVIAANLREIAGDSRVVCGSVFYTAKKVFRIGNALVGVAGDAGLTTKFLAWFRKECPPDEIGMTLDDDHTFSALVLRDSGLYVFNDCTEPDHIDSRFFAIGVGADIAMTAMTLGKSPEEAVKLACRIDPMHCGLPVRSLSLRPTPSKPKRKTKPQGEKHGEVDESASAAGSGREGQVPDVGSSS